MITFHQWSDMDHQQYQILSSCVRSSLGFGLFFLVGLGRSGAAEQQGAPSPFPWDPWGPPYHQATAADVVWLCLPLYKVKQVAASG